MTDPAALWRIDTRLVYPPLVVKMRAVLDECAREGADFFVVCGYRSPDQQNTEYLKGRETPGINPRPDRPMGDPVTWVRAYGSFHQYGLAVDATRDGDPARPGLQPSWATGDYAVLARVAEKHGLRSLGPTKGDWPHVEVPVEKWGLSLHMLRVTMKSAPTPELGMQRVRALCDRQGVLRG